MREGSWSEANRKMHGTVVRCEKVKQEPVPLDTEIRHPAGIALNSSGEPKARWHYSQAFSQYTRHSSRQEYARDLKYMNSSSHAYRRSEYSLSDCRSSHRSHRKHRRHH
ncbi:uncharacterized protein LOC119462154 isoform X2 [Dermacentor silvarum]|uniref:uncharacterized protein LOC119462154 isoform X2 n=1 Tax=Dermacentor silvarum TaxID=543639 RepID=UPI00210138B0|nr:uncharacterized protein LOC119462154 isoform X2 [Dermacentor silvarum]